MRIFGVCTGVWRKMGSHTPKGNFSSKRGNKNFYKGKGVKQYGKVTQYGTQQKRKQKRKQKGGWAFLLETHPATWRRDPRASPNPASASSRSYCSRHPPANGRQRVGTLPPPSKRICAGVCVLSSHWRVEFGRRLT